MQKILIIANARRKGGLSGGDNIYLNFAKHWPCKVDIWDMVDIDFKPFFICYIYRIILSIVYGIRFAYMKKLKYDIVYSSSDFLMDVFPAMCFKNKGSKWIAGFYLFATHSLLYRFSQAIAYNYIHALADKVCITNDSMKQAFVNMETISVNGGVDMSRVHGYKAGIIKYDAVFCGRIHHTKGINELISVWIQVKKAHPYARLAIIGDGDLGKGYISRLVDCKKYGIDLLGFMGKERYQVYWQSKFFLYTSTDDHFSMSPVEAMACRCPMLAFKLPVMDFVKPKGTFLYDNVNDMADGLISLMDEKWKDIYNSYSITAQEWAKTWDWPITCKRVWEEING